MNSNESEWTDFRDLVTADTKSLAEMMDVLSHSLRRAIALFETASPFDPELIATLSKLQTNANDRLRGLVIDNSTLREMPDCAELYLLRGFKAQIEVMIWAMDNGIRQHASRRGASG